MAVNSVGAATLLSALLSKSASVDAVRLSTEGAAERKGVNEDEFTCEECSLKDNKCHFEETSENGWKAFVAGVCCPSLCSWDGGKCVEKELGEAMDAKTGEDEDDDEAEAEFKKVQDDTFLDALQEDLKQINPFASSKINAAFEQINKKTKSDEGDKGDAGGDEASATETDNFPGEPKEDEPVEEKAKKTEKKNTKKTSKSKKLALGLAIFGIAAAAAAKCMPDAGTAPGDLSPISARPDKAGGVSSVADGAKMCKQPDFKDLFTEDRADTKMKKIDDNTQTSDLKEASKFDLLVGDPKTFLEKIHTELKKLDKQESIDDELTEDEYMKQKGRMLMKSMYTWM